MPTLIEPMDSQVRTRSPRDRPRAASRGAAAVETQPRGLGRLFAGGTAGNERLTILAGLLLIVAFAALGLTIVAIGRLLWWHLFIGLLLIGPVLLKMASTGYRFLRYYTGNRRYTAKGPPPAVLRLLAPLVVFDTVIVFISGVVLLYIGPASSLRDKTLLIHKASFILWLVLVAVHVLGHLPEILRFLRIGGAARAELLIAQATRAPVDAHPVEPPADRPVPGRGGRWLSLGTALVAGLVLAAVLVPQFHVWTGAQAAPYLHHNDH